MKCPNCGCRIFIDRQCNSCGFDLDEQLEY